MYKMPVRLCGIRSLAEMLFTESLHTMFCFRVVMLSIYRETRKSVIPRETNASVINV